MRFRKIKIFSIPVLLIISSSQVIFPQPQKLTGKDSTEIQQKDISDIFERVFKRKLHKDAVTLKGNGPFISILPAIGYSIHTGIIGVVATSTSFYTDDERKTISRILINGNYSQFHQYWFTSSSNIYLEKHKLHFSGDLRYYKFPTQTYGLGPDCPITNPLQIDYSYLRFHQVVFRNISPNLYAGIGYNLDYHWNIKVDSANSSAMNQFELYQKGNKSTSSGISFNILYDSRRNAVNPRNGTYANVRYRPNLTFLGSDKNWQSLLIEIRHYIKIPGNSNNILAIWSYNDITIAGTPPYLDMPSIGWDDYSNTGRGYVSGRYRARNLIYFESEYRFLLTRNGLLGGVIFGNAEILPERFRYKMIDIIPGGGFGLRIKINKHSDTNLTIDYGFGVSGSRGFFFNMGEVF
jgi:hypothetical protein